MLKKSFLIIASLLLFLGARAEETEAFAITFSSSTWPANSSYTTEITSLGDFGESTWNAKNVYYMSGWSYIRCGAPSTYSYKEVYFKSNSSIADAVTKVSIDVKKFTSSASVNAVTLYVADNASFSNSTTYTGTNFSAAGVYDISVSEPKENMYYKVSIKTKYSGSTGGSFDLNKIIFYKDESAGPEYPTECAAPTLSLEDGASVALGNVITATCDTPNSTVTLVVSVVEPVETYADENSTEQTIVGDAGTGTASFTIPEDLDEKTTYCIKAFATVQGKEGEIKSQETVITVTFDPLYSGVDCVVVAPECQDCWFDLNGNPVENPEKGLYIHVRNHKTEKVLRQ